MMAPKTSGGTRPEAVSAAGASGGLVSRRAHLAGLGSAAAAALAALPGRRAGAADGPGADPAVITDWNATAVGTIFTDAGKGGGEAYLSLGFAQAAVYNAVNGITRRYALYKWDVDGPPTASPQAAAAAAANRVLLTYFGPLPAARARLADAYATSLAKVADGAAKQQGVRYGERAADRLLGLRIDDGRMGPTSFTMPPAPGVWRPTPPAMAPFFTPWLATTRPLLLTADGAALDWGAYNADPRTWGAARNPDGTVPADAPGGSPGVTGWPAAFRPAGPPAMTSAAYAADFNEVKALGAKTSALRTPAQTETALYISNFTGVPFQAGLRDLAARRGFDISDSARLFAAVNMSTADAGLACWDCKLHFGFWRPITAIRQAGEDGNAATEADPAWEPLLATPPYPDYNSGLTSTVGALTQALTRVLGTDRIDVTVTSPATNTTRRYEYAAPLRQDALDARVWSGLHFRFADVSGLAGGTDIANWALDRYFRPR